MWQSTSLHRIALFRIKRTHSSRWTRYPHRTPAHKTAQNHGTKWHQKRHQIRANLMRPYLNSRQSHSSDTGKGKEIRAADHQGPAPMLRA